jgi:hypothetical protein
MKLDFISFDIPEDKKIEVMSLLSSSSDSMASQHLKLKMEGEAKEIVEEIIETKKKILEYLKNEL